MQRSNIVKCFLVTIREHCIRNWTNCNFVWFSKKNIYIYILFIHRSSARKDTCNPIKIFIRWNFVKESPPSKQIDKAYKQSSRLKIKERKKGTSGLSSSDLCVEGQERRRRRLKFTNRFLARIQGHLLCRKLNRLCKKKSIHPSRTYRLVNTIPVEQRARTSGRS